MVSSQERRELFVTIINRLSIGCQPLVMFLHLSNAEPGHATGRSIQDARSGGGAE